MEQTASPTSAATIERDASHNTALQDATTPRDFETDVKPALGANIRPDFDPSQLDGLDPDSLEHYEFGGKVADMVGADLSGDRNEEKRSPEEIEREEAMKQAARKQDWKAKLADMDYDARVTATLECLGRKNTQKEILYDLLVYCRQERTEQEATDFLTNHKQFADGYHSPSRYLFFMQRTGAIEELEYDIDGVLITEDMRQELRDLGAPEDEIEDLGASWSYVTTDVGREAIEQFDPAKRTREMLATQATSRLATYRRVLEFCEQPRSLDEIVEFLKDDAGLEIDPKTGIVHMQPSAYIGKLDAAGALTWDGGWKTTDGGMEVLTTIDVND